MQNNTDPALLSVVIPAYNEEAMIPRAVESISGILKAADIPYELLFVDDGSKDSSWQRIREAAGPGVRGLHFSRNFGKESAIYAGLYHAKGACCAVIDCDLQHPPEKLVEMYRLWQQGYEIVEAVKADRGDESPFHAFAAKAFYSIISRSAGFDMRRASDFKLLDRKAVTVLLNLRERNSFFRALSTWIGFRTTQIEFEVRPRALGESKWSNRALMRYAISNISSFSTAPMQIVTALGVVTMLICAVLGGISLVQKLTGRSLDGFTTVILIQGFSSSVIMLSLGIIGYYIARIYDEVRARPKYIVSETCGGEDDEHLP